MMHDFGRGRGLPRAAHRAFRSCRNGLQQGKPHFGFDTTLAVLPRDHPRRDDLLQEDIRWFKRGNCFASHVLNAWQEGTKVHFLTCEAKNNMFPFFPDVHGRAVQRMAAMSFLTDWTVDMASNGEELRRSWPG